MSFSFKSESNNKMSFLDADVSRKNGRFKNTVHRKMTFNIVYPHLDGFLPTTYRFSKIYTLSYRCFKILSNWTSAHNELVLLKQTFLKNENLGLF